MAEERGLVERLSEKVSDEISARQPHRLRDAVGALLTPEEEELLVVPRARGRTWAQKKRDGSRTLSV